MPVLYADDNYYLKAKWASLSLSGLTYALIYEKEEGKKSVEIVTTFPDSKYLSSEEKPKLFSGTVYVEDWNGKFIKSLRHIDGKVFLLEVTLQEKRSLLMDDCTEIIDWYTCSSSDGGSTWDCHLSYTEVIFIPCDDGGGGDVASSSSYVYTPADDGGGTPADETDVAEECNCDICPVCGGCLSTSFKYVPADDDTTDPTDDVPDCPPCSCPDTDTVLNTDEVKIRLCESYNGIINIESIKNSIENLSNDQEQFLISIANVAALYELGMSLEGLQSDLVNYSETSILYSKFNKLNNHELYTAGWEEAFNSDTGEYDALISNEIGSSGFRLKYYSEKVGEYDAIGIVKDGFIEHSVEAALELFEWFLANNFELADDFLYDMHLYNALNYMEDYCNE